MDMSVNQYIPEEMLFTSPKPILPEMIKKDKAGNEISHKPGTYAADGGFFPPDLSSDRYIDLVMTFFKKKGWPPFDTKTDPTDPPPKPPPMMDGFPVDAGVSTPNGWVLAGSLKMGDDVHVWNPNKQELLVRKVAAVEKSDEAVLVDFVLVNGHHVRMGMACSTGDPVDGELKPIIDPMLGNFLRDNVWVFDPHTGVADEAIDTGVSPVITQGSGVKIVVQGLLSLLIIEGVLLGVGGGGQGGDGGDPPPPGKSESLTDAQRALLTDFLNDASDEEFQRYFMKVTGGS
jgi:hypothetical protein